MIKTSFLSATKAPSSTPPPAGWQILRPETYFGRDLEIKTIKTVSPNTMWILTKSNDVFVFHQNRLTPVSGLKVTSLAVSPYGVWALDVNGHIHYRDGVTPTNPEGSTWRFTNRNDQNFKEISNGPYGTVIGKHSISLVPQLRKAVFLVIFFILFQSIFLCEAIGLCDSLQSVFL